MESKFTNSSLNEILKSVISISNRSLVILQGLTEALITDTKQNIEINLEDSEGNPVTYVIPSLGFLTNKVIGLETTYNTLSESLDTKYTDDVKNTQGFISPDSIKNTPIFSNDSASVKLNYEIMENLFSNICEVDVDVSESINLASKNIIIKKIIIDIDNEFDDVSVYKDVNVLKNYLSGKGISYLEQEETYEFEPIKLAANGEYDVIELGEYWYEIDPVTGLSKLNQFVKLNNNNVNVYDTNYRTSKTLQIGDKLAISDTVEYEITGLPTTSNGFYTISGVVALNLNATLHLVSIIGLPKVIHLKINPNKKTVLFFKQVSTASFIASDMFSNGLLLDPKQIIYKSIETGEDYSIYEYFNLFSYDYSEYLKSISAELFIPAIAGIKPNAPILVEDNFRVVIDNSHLFEGTSDTVSELLKTYTYENSILTAYNTKISDLEIELKNYESDTPEYQAVLDELNNYRTLASEARSRVTDSILQLKENEYLIDNNTNAEYVIQGAWEFPAPQVDKKGRNQDVVQFEVEYSYLDLGKDQNCSPNIDFVKLSSGEEGQSLIKTVFPKQNVVTTVLRSKVLNEKTGHYEWEFSNYSNLESEVNCNTIKIPIHPKETVMIRCRSISEAGYPYTKIFSDWSDPLYVQFPDRYETIEAGTIEAQKIKEEITKTTSSELEIAELRSQIEDLKTQIATMSSNITNLSNNRGVVHIKSEHGPLTSAMIDGTQAVTQIPGMVEGSFILIDTKLGLALMKDADYKVAEDKSIFLTQEYKQKFNPIADGSPYRMWWFSYADASSASIVS